MLQEKFITKQLLLNWAGRILFFTSLSALLPTMPAYLNEIGGNKSQIGIVMSAFALGVLAFRPLVGKQIDSVGRKAVLIAGTVIFTLAPLFYIYVHSINTLLPIRVFHGLGLAAFGTASITLITDAAPGANRGAVISYTGMVNTIAFAVGPVLGSYVGDKWGYDVLFGLVSGLAFVSLFISLFINETKKAETNSAPVKYWQAIRQRRILVSAAIIFLVGMVQGGVMFYIPLFLKETLTVNIGLFFAVYGTAAFLIRLIIGPMSDKLGRGPLLVFSLCLLTAGVFALSQTTSVLLMFIAAVLYGFGFGSHQPTLTALVADNTTDETRGKIFSFYYGGFDLGISIAGIFLGAIAEHFGIKEMFIVCSGFTIAALLLFLLGMESSPIQSVRHALSLQKLAKKCDICDQYQEGSPKAAEAYFKTNQN
ncbi:MAG: MFS transporter [Calditrichaeota bacterium]|nr:MFS transporter [candidate division KSB1 bacterium]MCZ6819876.1 MFS transporter [Calditrichota bacterium]